MIGLADDSEACRSLAQILQVSRGKGTFEETYRESFNSIAIGTADVSCLCVIKRGGFNEIYSITQDNPPILQDTQTPVGIGIGEIYIRPHLSRSSNVVDLNTAIDFGKTLIEYSARIEGSVGSPSQYGTDIGVIPINGKIYCKKLDPEIVPLDKILYRF